FGGMTHIADLKDFTNDNESDGTIEVEAGAAAVEGFDESLRARMSDIVGSALLSIDKQNCIT
ncbi:1562_t:CDS:1, partial [Acaulospora morrowiae]